MTKYDANTPIILIHGLGQDSFAIGTNSISFFAVKKTLHYKGYTNIINPYYNTKGNLDNSVKNAEEEILKYISKDTEVIMIGHSLGGLVALKLNQNGWKTKYIITIASPLKGTKMIEYVKTDLPNSLKWMEETLPTITDMLKTPIWHDLIKLKENPIQKPEHPVTTISTSLLNTEFDGRVTIEDTKLDDNDDHHHFNWSEHSCILADMRLLMKISELM